MNRAVSPHARGQQQRRHPAGLWGLLLAHFIWVHRVTVRPLVHFWNYTVLGALEESISSLIREALALTQRTINGASAWTLSVFNRDYKEQLRGRWAELAERHRWWGEQGRQKQSTLNAVLARRFGDGGDAGRPRASFPGATAPAPAPTLRHAASISGGGPLQPAAPQGDSGPALPARMRRRAAPPAGADGELLGPASREAGAEGADGGAAAAAEAARLDSTAASSSQRQQQREEGGAAGGQWWGQGAALLSASTPNWLAAVSEEAQEAAAAAQEAASAAAAQVQLAASSASRAVEQAVEEAAAAAAALARNMRAVFEQQPAGWGASEAIRRTGLLEDAALFSQLLVTRVFDGIRWLVGSLTLVGTATTPTGAQASAAAGRWLLRPVPGARRSSLSGGAGARLSSSGGARLSSGGGGRPPTPPPGPAAEQGAAPAGGTTLTGRLWRLLWPWARQAPRRRPGAAGAAAASSGSPPASPTRVGVWRRSATSVDLPRSEALWAPSSSEEDEGSEEETSSFEWRDDEEEDAGRPCAGSAAGGGLAASPSVPLPPPGPRQPLRSALSGGGQLQRAASFGAAALEGAASASTNGGKLSASRAAAALTGVPTTRVAFAAASGEERGASAATGAAAAVGGSPFASAFVQEKHHRAISRQEWSQRLREREQRRVSLDSGRPRPAAGREARGSRGGSGEPDQPQQQGPRRRRRRQREGEARDGSPARRPRRWSSSSGGSGGGSGGMRQLQRTHSGPAVSELKDVSSAGQVIRMAGYPLEVHEVVTPDGYLLRMERIPQHASTDVVFMMHGVLDTSLTWVAGGITGSQAFAAWDRGFDVWLGTSRSNPPHAAVDPRRRGSAYWRYTHNEVGTFDIGSQVDHIHATKLRELAALGISANARVLSGGGASASLSGAGGGAGGAAERQAAGEACGGASVGSFASAAGDDAFQSPAPSVPSTPCSSARSGGGGGGGSGGGASLGSWHMAGLGRAESAAEVDAAAAAEAAEAFSRHRAAAAAAGVAGRRRRGSVGGGGSDGGGVAQRGGSGSSARDGFWWLGGRLPGRGQSSRLSRRTSSVDLSEVASAVAAARAGAGASEAGATRQLQQQQQQQQPAAAAAAVHADASSSSPRSSGGSGSSVACTVEVSSPPQGPSPTKAAQEGQEGGCAAAAAAAAGQRPRSRLGSSGGSMRLAASAPDLAALAAEHSAGGSSGGGGAGTEAKPEQQQQQQPDGRARTPDGPARDQPPQPVPQPAAQPVPPPPASAFAAAAAQLPPAPQPPRRSASGASGGGAVHAADAGEPYNLRVVCHSLGGLVVLIYCTQRVREGRPHHVRRLIMLSPAGFHRVIPGIFKPLVYAWGLLVSYMAWVWRQQAFPVHLPTFVARLLAFKLSVDTSRLPAVGDLVRSLARLLLGGDLSAWDRALVMPHYSAAGMPLLSSLQVMHFVQLYRTQRCQLYDYGSPAANAAAYHQPTPPVLSEQYHALRGVPVHLVAGLHDGVIPPANIRCHHEAMRRAGVDVSYREFDYGHMDFTFSAKEELGYYVMSLLARK